MSSKTYQLDEGVHRYLVSTTIRNRSVLCGPREKTATLEAGGMQISPEQGQFVQFSVVDMSLVPIGNGLTLACKR